MDPLLILSSFCLISLLPPLRGNRLGLNLPVRPLWGSILFGKGFKLKGVKGVFTTPHVLHGVLSSAALAVEKQTMCYLLIYGGSDELIGPV